MKGRQTVEEGKNVKECSRGQEFEACNPAFEACRPVEWGRRGKKEKEKR